MGRPIPFNEVRETWDGVNTELTFPEDNSDTNASQNGPDQLHLSLENQPGRFMGANHKLQVGIEFAQYTGSPAAAHFDQFMLDVVKPSPFFM